MRRWTRTVRFLDWISLVAVLLAVGWIAVPSSVFLRPVAFDVQADMVRFVRETPFGTVQGEWFSEITLIDGNGLECNSGEYRAATYQAIEGDAVSYRLQDWARPCLDAGPPYFVSNSRRIILFGFLPLRPVRTVSEIQGERVSTQIIIVPIEE